MPDQPALIPFTQPDWHNILAKSNPPESLITHTWLVLSRLADQLRLHPTLAQDVGESRLWHWLYWGTFLHDFGKGANGFQDVLHGRRRSWGYRHEALSLAFVDWLFPRGNPDRSAVIAVIACHHKDADDIRTAYGKDRFGLDDDDGGQAGQMLKQVTPGNQAILYHWLAACGQAWAQDLGFARHLSPVSLIDEASALKPITPSTIHRAIEDLLTFTEHSGFREDSHAARLGTLLRGLILIADHAGSATSKNKPFPALDLPDLGLHRKLIRPGYREYTHQTASAGSDRGSALLIAPTGSGKTEAAFLWLNRQAALDEYAPAHIFYMLPYQASMNAMYQRLEKTFGKGAIGLQHGHAQQAIYAIALSDELGTESAETAAKINEEMSALHRFPINVQSPYQMLKAPYQMKGHEAILTGFQGGRFIFDEIHAYEASRLALIVSFMAFLYQHADARFFIMSATLPSHIRAVLREAVPDLHVIEATQATFAAFQRHTVHLLPGALSDDATLDRIAADAQQGKSVLVCCNTVRRAKEIYQLIIDRLPDHPIILVHSRFNSRDRGEKERQIMEQVGVESRNESARLKPIVVATQVIEVSLNIDLDTLYTEAAPLEALLQRFGRVNRSRAEKILAGVYIVREQPDNVKYIYAPELIDATIAILATIGGQPIDEGKVNGWLDQVYTGQVLEAWQTEYRTSAARFDQNILGTLRPFATDRAAEDAFNELFEGVEVLPEQDYAQWRDLMEEQKFLEASTLLIPLRWNQYKRLRDKGKAWSDEEKPRYRKVGRYTTRMFFVDVPYSPDSGLDIEAGLQDDVPMEAD